ncbi:hypothetical protein H0H87_001463 [Tephrocybe sp. NHM501043]|nr:hypothetical protein H0H87_001463 [Tephrocybe sp. NHM501043]
MPVATTLLRHGANALEIAGAIVPFVGAAAVIVREIEDSCRKFYVHKRKAQRMAMKCLELQAILSEQNRDQVGAEMQEKIDEANAYVHLFLIYLPLPNKTEQLQSLREDQKQSSKDFAKSLDRPVRTGLMIHNNQREANEMQLRDNADIKDILVKILSNQGGELAQVNVLDEHVHVAQTLMHDGQKVLHQGSTDLSRSIRQNSDPDQLMFTEIRSTSPPPLPTDSQRYLEQQRKAVLEREVVQNGLAQLHELTGIPPSIKLMNGEVTRIGDLAIAGGTYSDIWQGLWLGKKKVALKALRNIKATDPKARKVSPWQDFGNVLEYTKQVVDADKICLLSGAAKGLQYLHSKGIIHGNVKCANILVTQDREACICDFGMSKVIEDVTEKSASATLTASGSARWLAPELIEGIVSSPTKDADTYSYAMAMLELITGKHPFSNRRRDASVIHDIVVLKKIPTRPTETEVLPWLSDNLWALMTECWKVPASGRPSMEQVSTRIAEIQAGVDKREQLEPIMESDSDAMDTT